jgi:hypothetical protein
MLACTPDTDIAMVIGREARKSSLAVRHVLNFRRSDSNPESMEHGRTDDAGERDVEAAQIAGLIATSG